MSSSSEKRLYELAMDLFELSYSDEVPRGVGWDLLNISQDIRFELGRATPPERPSDPRTEPWYISGHCECGVPLVKHDELSDESLRRSHALADPDLTDRSKVWHDEWVCPRCLDGVHLDMPEGML